MKKILSILCAIALLLSTAAVLAEASEETIEIGQQAPDFSITMTLPEGYTSEQTYEEGNMIVSIYNEADADNNSTFIVTVGFSEEYDGQTLTELTEEEKAAFIEQMGIEMNNPVFSQSKTSHGTAVFFLEDETDDPSLSYAIGMSIYEGYVINMHVFPGNDKVLTDEDISLGLEILSETWFTPAA